MQDTVLVINQNDRQTQAIVKKLRAEGICALMVSADISTEAIQTAAPKGLIIAGGVSGDIAPCFDAKWLQSGLPILALGDAALSLLTVLGGTPETEALPSGLHAVSANETAIACQFGDNEWYLSNVFPLSLCETLTSWVDTNSGCIGFSHRMLPLFGLQMHIEQNDLDAAQILSTFAVNVCLLKREWESKRLIDLAVHDIKTAAGDGAVLLELSGGVDSSVCALLGQLAAGDKLRCYIVDTGLLRPAIMTETLAFFRDEKGISVSVVDAKARFFKALSGLISQSEKEHAIHTLLENIRAEQKAAMGAGVVLSAVNASDMMIGEAEHRADVTVPLTQFFKDEVRRLGESLGLPADIYSRQPFPETGLALRFLGAVDAEKIALLQQVDRIFLEEMEKSGQGKKLWQYFAMLMPIGKEYIACLRAVNLVDGMQVQPARLAFDLLEDTTNRILNEVPCVVRVLYDFTGQPCAGDIQWP